MQYFTSVCTRLYFSVLRAGRCVVAGMPSKGTESSAFDPGGYLRICNVICFVICLKRSQTMGFLRPWHFACSHLASRQSR